MYRNWYSLPTVSANFVPNSSPAFCLIVIKFPKQADSYLLYEDSIHDDFLYSLL